MSEAYVGPQKHVRWRALQQYYTAKTINLLSNLSTLHSCGGIGCTSASDTFAMKNLITFVTCVNWLIDQKVFVAQVLLKQHIITPTFFKAYFKKLPQKMSNTLKILMMRNFLTTLLWTCKTNNFQMSRKLMLHFRKYFQNFHLISMANLR